MLRQEVGSDHLKLSGSFTLIGLEQAKDLMAKLTAACRAFPEIKVAVSILAGLLEQNTMAAKLLQMPDELTI